MLLRIARIVRQVPVCEFALKSLVCFRICPSTNIEPARTSKLFCTMLVEVRSLISLLEEDDFEMLTQEDNDFHTRVTFRKMVIVNSPFFLQVHRLLHSSYPSPALGHRRRDVSALGHGAGPRLGAARCSARCIGAAGGVVQHRRGGPAEAGEGGIIKCYEQYSQWWIVQRWCFDTRILFVFTM